MATLVQPRRLVVLFAGAKAPLLVVNYANTVVFTRHY